ncbi:hypothetical protein [Caproiciproducens galactitolivorans]|uniref:Uncharacterized protein n=1 Tax=Caproiciproducens galactitolivorans TaxID=642589 RepID=A0A4Z0YF66_9FIRM|nr:hypothetical protein [Caproiciproducens galactitolivorans]TGJ77861.1 hypothetical protein CAGA_02670 [Caproiciproducens galactitolivorans]
MADLNDLLRSDAKAKEYYESLPQYAREAAKKKAAEISTADALHLFAETFMQDDSYRGA